MSVFNDPYKDGLKDLVVYYCSLSNTEELINKFQSVRSVTEGLYQVLVKTGIKPIENLDEVVKRDYWNRADKGLEKFERMRAAKAIYVIDILKS